MEITLLNLQQIDKLIRSTKGKSKVNTGFKIDNLQIIYSGHDRVEAVRNVSFESKPGECVALIGKTGSGKTTIAKALAGLLPGQARINPESKILFDGMDIRSIPKSRLFEFRKSVRYIFQQPLECFNPILRLGKQFSDIIKLHEGSGRSPRARSEEVLAKVYLKDYNRMLSAYPHELSLGQLQRVNMAMALVGQPKVILADEPLASVDAINRNEIIEIFKEMQKVSGIGLMIISHDLQLVQALADRWLVLKEGTLFDHGEGSILQSSSSNEYTRELIAAYQNLLAPRAVKKVSVAPVLKIRNLTYNYQSEKGIWKWEKRNFEALRNINMTLYDKDTLGLIGESGSGKSTLAMIMGGLLYPGADKLFLNEEEVLAGQYASKSYYKKIQYILQEAESSFAPKRRVGKQLTDVISAFKIPTRSKNQMVLDFLNDLGLDKSYFNRFSHELSGGEKQRIAFARAMLVQPEILILDESFSGLDRKTLHENLKVLLSLQTKYSFAIILISHDINLIGHFCNRVIVLKEGQLIEEGLKDTILSNPSDPYTKKLIEAAQIPR